MPLKVSDNALLSAALKQINLIANPETENSPFINDSCGACQAALLAAKMVALAAPEEGPTVVVGLCNALQMSSDCSTSFGPLALGNVITQVLANADVTGYDGQVSLSKFRLRRNFWPILLVAHL